MNGARARRQLIRWARYGLHYPDGAGGNFGGTGVHKGHVNANWRAMTVGRAAPRGIRRPPWEPERRRRQTRQTR